MFWLGMVLWWFLCFVVQVLLFCRLCLEKGEEGEGGEEGHGTIPSMVLCAMCPINHSVICYAYIYSENPMLYDLWVGLIRRTADYNIQKVI